MSRMGGPLGGGQLGPVLAPVLGAQILAKTRQAQSLLDQHGTAGRHRPLAGLPLGDRGRLHASQHGQARQTTSQLDGFNNGRKMIMLIHTPIIRHYLHQTQGIAEIFSETPNSGMSQKKHIGERLQQEAEEKGLKPPQVAELFGVKTPSVYDWYAHGRVHKKHYPKLVEWSGKPIEWWLDIEIGHTVADQTAPPYADADPRHQVLLDLFEGLPSTEQDALIKTLKEKKQHYDAVIEELTARKSGKAA